MSAFRRRLMAMQKKDSIDWDYEWSYLSGELPSDERFIETASGDISITENGMKLGVGANLNLNDIARVICFIKFQTSFDSINRDRGLMFVFTNSENTFEKKFILAGSANNYRIATHAEIPTSYIGSYEDNVDIDLLFYMDLDNPQNIYVEYQNDKKYLPINSMMWFEKPSKIQLNQYGPVEGGYVLLKELKFKIID